MDKEERKRRKRRAYIALTILLGSIYTVFVLKHTVFKITINSSSDALSTVEDDRQVREGYTEQGLPIRLKAFKKDN